MSIFSRRLWEITPPATKHLLIINVLIFVAMLIMPPVKADWIIEHGGLRYFTCSDFNPIQLITSMFIHGGFVHLFFNMFALYMFGMHVEWAMGTKRFLVFYFACGIGAGIVQEAVWAIMMPHFIDDFILNLTAPGYVPSVTEYDFVKQLVSASLVTIGASGAIYGILLAFGMLFPNRELQLLFPPIPVKAKWLVLAYGVIELLLGLSDTGDGIAHFAHLGGMIFGFFILLYWMKKGTLRRGY